MGEGRVKVGASAGKKVNLGNYESYDINLWEEKEVNETESSAEREKLFDKLRNEISTWEKVVRGIGEEPEDKKMEKIVLSNSHLESLKKGESIVFPNKKTVVVLGG